MDFIAHFLEQELRVFFFLLPLCTDNTSVLVEWKIHLQTLHLKGTGEDPFCNSITSDNDNNMSTSKFYIYSLIIGIVSIIVGSVHPWIIKYFYFISGMSLTFIILACVIEFGIEHENGRDDRIKLIKELILANVLFLISAALQLSSGAINVFQYFVITTGMIVGFLTNHSLNQYKFITEEKIDEK